MARYVMRNGASPTTAAQVKVTTGTAIKSLLQVGVPSGLIVALEGWDISFDGSAAATPIAVELIEVDVAATVTAASPVKYDSPSGSASLCVSGTSASGYTATAEGTITSARVLDAQLVPPTGSYAWEFTPGREPAAGAAGSAKYLRIRVTAGAAVNALCSVRWRE